ncbi:hypothetical protein GCQ56_17650 [Marinifilum sp. N1E240]|uniref:hypothetical protein n=1 Tax=Marinifilum sp. N1E240 TaxID=2608082 RepID=UPI00128D9C68|nr:hypothetical protein [Marinifilum sp. N1E240]MPQ48829.1 hypothetical protein [Marinifilum sp. N1E240]
MNKINAKINIVIILFVITLFGCSKDDIQSPTTLNKVKFKIEEDGLDDDILFNPQDKLIYYFTYNMNYNRRVTDFKINAFNYELKEISAQRKIKGLYNTTQPTTAIGVYNDQIELYFFRGDKLTILDPIDLTEITSLTIPDSFISSVQIKDGLLFVSHQVYAKRFVSVYNRQDFTLINQAGDPVYNPNYGYLLVYRDILNENQVKCASFPRYSTRNYFHEFVFDNQGNYLDFALGKGSYNSFTKTNDNVDFILTGEAGKILQKSKLWISNKPELDSVREFEDYFINANGTYIYSIQNDSSINRYNASTFIFEESLPINENGRKIFVDENQLIILDYNLYSAIDISFSFYQY